YRLLPYGDGKWIVQIIVDGNVIETRAIVQERTQWSVIGDSWHATPAAAARRYFEKCRWSAAQTWTAEEILAREGGCRRKIVDGSVFWRTECTMLRVPR